MDSNEKKPKRPRIGEPRSVNSEELDARYEKVNYTHSSDYAASADQSYSANEYNGERHYQPRNTIVRVDITVKEATIVKADIIVDIIRGITQDIMMVINHVSVPTLKT